MERPLSPPSTAGFGPVSVPHEEGLSGARVRGSEVGAVRGYLRQLLKVPPGNTGKSRERSSNFPVSTLDSLERPSRDRDRPGHWARTTANWAARAGEGLGSDRVSTLSGYIDHWSVPEPLLGHSWQPSASLDERPFLVGGN